MENKNLKISSLITGKDISRDIVLQYIRESKFFYDSKSFLIQFKKLEGTPLGDQVFETYKNIINRDLKFLNENYIISNLYFLRIFGKRKYSESYKILYVREIYLTVFLIKVLIEELKYLVLKEKLESSKLKIVEVSEILLEIRDLVGLYKKYTFYTEKEISNSEEEITKIEVVNKYLNKYIKCSEGLGGPIDEKKLYEKIKFFETKTPNYLKEVLRDVIEIKESLRMLKENKIKNKNSINNILKLEKELLNNPVNKNTGSFSYLNKCKSENCSCGLTFWSKNFCEKEEKEKLIINSAKEIVLESMVVVKINFINSLKKNIFNKAIKDESIYLEVNKVLKNIMSIHKRREKLFSRDLEEGI